MDSTNKQEKGGIIMYKMTEEVQTYYPIYGFVSKLKKGEVKQYDCFMWIYRMNELDNADKSIP